MAGMRIAAVVFLLSALAGAQVLCAADKCAVKPDKTAKAVSAQTDEQKLWQEKVETFFNALTTMEAKFIQSTYGSDGRLRHQCSGTLWIDRKARNLAMHTKDPQGVRQQVIVRKDRMRVYQDGKQAADEISVNDTPAGYLLKPKILFGKDIVTEYAQTADTVTVRMRDKAASYDMYIDFIFRKVPILQLQGWVFFDPQHNQTVVSFDPERYHLAVPVDPKLFEWPSQTQGG